MSDRVHSQVIDITGAEFEEKVLKESEGRPVLADFWAPWCRPCGVLGPILEKLAEEFQGRFLLVRVNTDEAPELAQIFRIQSIPTVILFRDGNPVEQFIGVLPEPQIRELLKKHCPTPVDRLVEAGTQHLEAQALKEARELFDRALQEQPDHADALAGRIRVALQEQDLERAGHDLGRLREVAPRHQELEELEGLLDFVRRCHEFGPLEQAQGRAQQSPGDLESLYRLACCLVAEKEYRQALETLLEIVLKDRSFRDDGARKAMLEIFKLVGVRSPLADEYRTRLSRVIF